MANKKCLRVSGARFCATSRIFIQRLYATSAAILSGAGGWDSCDMCDITMVYGPAGSGFGGPAGVRITLFMQNLAAF
jgi:hypothetical protein